MDKNNNIKFMKLAIKEARKGQYQTWKDPMVGCVVVKDGKVISSGYHDGYGKKHAVVNAIERLNDSQLNGATLYLTMEPCDACCKLIIQSKFKHIVIAQRNPKPEISGKNIISVALKTNNIDVTSGVLSEEAYEMNKFYNYFCENNRPWITIKQSLSLDHHVSPANGKRITLTNSKVHDYIHHERANYQALIIGSSTAIVDNPNLLTDVDSPYQPIRVVLDRRGRLLNNPGLNLLNYDKCETWIFTQNSNVRNMNLNSHVRVFDLKTDNIEEIIDILSDEGIQSLYVEGGPTLEKTFMDKGYVNQIVDYLSPIYFGGIGLEGAVPVHELSLENIDVKKIDNDIRITGDVKEPNKAVMAEAVNA